MDVEAILLVTAALVGIVGTYTCTKAEFEYCLQILQAVATSESQKQATTKSDLDKICHELQKGVKCVDDYSERCFGSKEQDVLNSIVSESRKVITDLCVVGELQNEYLKYAPCFQNISMDEAKCASKYRKIAILTQEKEAAADREVALKNFCCAITSFVLCKQKYAIKDCGPMASQFLQRHMDRMSGSLINEHCVAYTYEPHSCPNNGRQLKPGFETTALVVISLIFLL